MLVMILRLFSSEQECNSWHNYQELNKGFTKQDKNEELICNRNEERTINSPNLASVIISGQENATLETMLISFSSH